MASPVPVGPEGAQGPAAHVASATPPESGSPDTVRTPAFHLPALDGVRGTAIALVLLSHITPWPWVSGGWVGVDLFFVLSGFLITGILWDARESPHRARTFYMRRALRILPLYYGVLAGLFIIIPLVHPLHTTEYHDLAAEQWWYWTYLQNWRIAIAHPIDGGSLNWFWSLAIEEQFYLVWPLVVWYGSRRTIVRTCLATMAVGLALRAWLVHADPEAWHYSISIYVLTPCRLDGLAVGALLALGLRGPGGYGGLVRRVRPIALGCAALLVAIIGFQLRAGLPPFTRTPLMHIVGYPALATAFGGLLLAAMGPWRTVFALAPLRWLGVYSYGIYVFHPFVVRAFRQRSTLAFGGWAFAAAAVAVSLAVAWLSYQLYEKHWLALKRRFV